MNMPKRASRHHAIRSSWFAGAFVVSSVLLGGLLHAVNVTSNGNERRRRKWSERAMGEWCGVGDGRLANVVWTPPMLPWLRDEQQELEQAAREARWLTPEQRVELFASIMQMIGLIWESLPFEEQWRRLRIAEQLDGASDAVVVRLAAHGVVVMGVGDVPAVVERIAEVLARLGVQHVFGGAIAQNYWGVVRATQAVDVLALIPAQRLQAMVDALTAEGFRQRDADGREGMLAVAEVWAQQARSGLFAVWLGLVKVEIFSPVLPLQHRMLERARQMPWRGRMLR